MRKDLTKDQGRDSALSHFNFAFALMSIIPLLIALYLISVHFFSLWDFAGVNSFYFLMAIIIALLGLLVGRGIIKRILQQLMEANRNLKNLNETLEQRVRDRSAVAENRATQVARAQTELEQIAQVAAHNIQEPLKALSDFTQLFEERCKGKLDKDVDAMIHHVIDCESQLRELVGDLTSYLNIRKTEISLEPTNVEEIIKKVLGELVKKIEKTRAQITYDSLPTIMTNSKEMHQLLENLVTNALQFCDVQKPHVHISALHKDFRSSPAENLNPPSYAADTALGEWIFAISSNGTGVPPQYVERIFWTERLYIPGKYERIGIELPLCKKIVERHGGRIWMESLAGKGSAFYFTIPDR